MRDLRKGTSGRAKRHVPLGVVAAALGAAVGEEHPAVRRVRSHAEDEERNLPAKGRRRARRPHGGLPPPQTYLPPEVMNLGNLFLPGMGFRPHVIYDPVTYPGQSHVWGKSQYTGPPARGAPTLSILNQFLSELHRRSA